MTKTLVAASFYTLLTCAARPESSLEIKGFDFCARPSRPSCVDLDSTYTSEPKTAECRRQVSVFLKSVVKFRACLDRVQSELVLQLNATIEKFKCRSHAMAPC